MKNKILMVAFFAAAALFLTGCIVVNVERTAPASSSSITHTNTVAAPVTK